jgi:cell division protein FtsB
MNSTQNRTSHVSTPRKQKKSERELLLTVSMFLLGREELRKLFWTVRSVNYDKSAQKVAVGITTVTGKLGTTLTRLRKTSKELSDFLYEQGLTFRKAKIQFFVDKEDEKLQRVYNLLEQVEHDPVLRDY